MVLKSSTIKLLEQILFEPDSLEPTRATSLNLNWEKFASAVKKK